MWWALAAGLVVVMLVGGLGLVAFRATARAAEARAENEGLHNEIETLKDALAVAGLPDPTLDELDGVFNS